jgi:hypothetical protein
VMVLGFIVVGIMLYVLFSNWSLLAAS